MFRCGTAAIAAGTPGCEEGREACDFVIGRDANGACGIFIRTLILAMHPELVHARATVVAPTAVAGAQ